MIIFQNEGSLDPRFITTMGVNVKGEGSNPIGYFGTGLKYAIAVLLRNQHEIIIYSNGHEYHFRTVSATLRGKEFQFIYMDTFDGVHTTPQELGFTTELGKNWKLWQAYRELHCNTFDEYGQIIKVSDNTKPDILEDATIITIRGREFDEIHDNRHEFILDPSLRHAHNNGMEIHEGKAIKLFYKGIAVLDLPRPTMFHYNLAKAGPGTHISLTEDRTVESGTYTGSRLIAAALLLCEDRGIIEKALLGGVTFWEHHLDYSWPGSLTAGETFLSVCKEHRKDNNFSKSALDFYKSVAPIHKEIPPLVDLTAVQKQQLDKACKFLRSIGYTVWAKDQMIVEFLEDQIMGRVLNDQPYIALLAFEQGTKRLAGTILEEHLHISKGFMDNSREFQDYLIDRLMSMGEELMGEPL